MKRVIEGKELENIILKGAHLLCGSVSKTLGPTGNNVIINTSDSMPYITNDGVTIAREIESDDIKINTVLEILKEASLKTNETVGDGTTTTLVLLESILENAFLKIESGKNKIVLKNEINNTLEKAVNEINKLKKEPSKKDLYSIANISSNDESIGNLVTEVFLKVKSKYQIKLEESSNNETYYEIKNGYTLEIDNISPLYFQNKKEIILKNSYVLVLRGYLENLEQINEIINECLENNENLIIFASEYNEEVYENILVYKLQYNKNIFIFKTPDYGIHKNILEEDIAFITKGNVKNININNINFNDLGVAKNIIINKNDIAIINKGENLKERINSLKKELSNTNSEYEKEFIANRIAKLSNGMATIYVGGNTKTEIKEKIMRFEDSICALEIAKDGIAFGEGITYLKVSDLLKEETTGDTIIKNALETPFKTIMENAGINYNDIIKKIRNENYSKIFNIEKNKLESITDTNIIDPIKVIVESLKNAISIASMLITTNTLVINEKEERKIIDI